MKCSLSVVLGLLLTSVGVLTRSQLMTPAWAQCGLPGQPPPFTSAVHDLDEDASAWGVFCEGSPTFDIRNVPSPSLDGRSLECAITGGSEPHSNVHCFLSLAAAPEATYFILKMSFRYTPRTTHAAQDSLVQALELTMNKWQDARRYEWALQWRNVGEGQNPGEGAPQWYYWDGGRSGSERWVPLRNLPFDHRLEANRWHTFILDGSIEGGDIKYRRFVLENDGYSLSHELNVTAPPVVRPEEEVDRVSVAFQLDGNSESAPYQVFFDDVSLIRTRCVPDDGALCLNDGRFRVSAVWRTAMASGQAVPAQLTNDTGYFWFFTPENVEIVLKALNGCSINNHFWVFGSGLTNVAVEITVEDTETGDTRTYSNALGTPFEVILDTNAFMTCP